MNSEIEVSESTNKLSPRLDAIARSIIIAVTLLLPLFVLPTSWLPLPMVKATILSFGVLSALIIWSVARLNEHRVDLPNTHVLWAALALVAGYFLTSILSSNVLHSLIGFGFERDTLLSMLSFVGFLAVVALTTTKPGHILRLQKSMLLGFLLLGIFQIIRITFGADATLPSLFSNDPTVTLLGSWNDLAVFSGLAVIMALSSLALFSYKKIARGGLYAVLAVALFLLVVVNLTVVWATLAVITFMLAIYIFSDASYDGESGKFKPRIPIKKLVPSFLVLVISIIFIVGGTGIGQKITGTFNIAYVDVRPSWEGTVTVGTGVFQGQKLFGIGPNSFKKAWIDYKPVAVNETNFWNTDFDFGVGLIPTAFVSGGLVLGILWLLFFASFVRMGATMLMRRMVQPAHMYIAASSFAGAMYLWVLTIMYVPQTVMLAYAFALTGITIAAARIVGVVRTREIHAKNSYTSGIILTGSLLCVAVISFGAFIVNTERVVASSMLSRAIVALNNGDTTKAEYIAERASFFGQDVRTRQLQTQIGLVELTEIINTQSDDIEAQRELFQTALTKTIDAAQKAILVDRSNYQNWLLLADVYARLVPLQIEGASDSAVQAYEEAGLRNKKNPEIPLRLARLVLAQEDFEGAKIYAQQSLALKSNYTDAYYLLSQIAIQESDVRKAIESTEAAVLLQPTNAGLLFQLGVLQYSTNAFDKVIPVLERAVAINANYSNALYFLGLAYDQTGNAQAALAAFERIAALNPDNVVVQKVVTALTEGESAVEALGEAAPKISDFGQLPVSKEQ